MAKGEQLEGFEGPSDIGCQMLPINWKSILLMIKHYIWVNESIAQLKHYDIIFGWMTWQGNLFSEIQYCVYMSEEVGGIHVVSASILHKKLTTGYSQTILISTWKLDEKKIMYAKELSVMKEDKKWNRPCLNCLVFSFLKYSCILVYSWCHKISLLIFL